MSESANVLAVEGPLNMSTATNWLERGRAALKGDDLLVDFSAVTEADSAALALLLDWMRAAQASGRVLRYAGMPVGMRSLAALYGVDELISSTA